MAIKRELLPLPTSIVVTIVAYGVLSFVIFRERPGAVQSDFVNRLLAFLPHAIAFVNALALVLLVIKADSDENVPLAKLKPKIAAKKPPTLLDQAMTLASRLKTNRRLKQ